MSTPTISNGDLKRQISFLLVVLTCILSIGNTANAGVFEGIFNVNGEPDSINNVIGSGKWALVMFWTTDCVSCAKQKPGLSELHSKRKNHDLTIVGVSLDGIDNLRAVQTYLGKHKTSFDNYISNFENIGDLYKDLTASELRGTPTYLLFDPSGDLVGNQRGPITPKAIEEFINQ